MKIGYFVTHFPDPGHQEAASECREPEEHSYVGAVLSAYHLARHMASRGHEIHVFTTATSSRSRLQNSEGLAIHRFGTIFRVASANMSLGLFTQPLQNEVDIVHAHFSVPPCTMAALWYARRKKRPLVVTYHGDWVDSFGSTVRRVGLFLYNKYLLPQILSSACLITCPTERYIEQSRFLHQYRSKTIAVPNGIVVENFEIEDPPSACRRRLGLPLDARLLLYVGSLIDHKGLDVLLKAMPGVLRSVPDTLLVLVGHGPLRQPLQMLARQLGIADQVVFTGLVREDITKARYYRASDLFVLPSTLTESFGMVSLEAMACGVPIVASTVGGIPDVITNEKEGLLVPPGDVQTLSRTITKLLNDDRLRSEMSKRGLEKVQNYSWHKVAQKMEDVYRQVLVD